MGCQVTLALMELKSLLTGPLVSTYCGDPGTVHVLKPFIYIQADAGYPILCNCMRFHFSMQQHLES